MSTKPKLKRAVPWIEPGLYVECPYCGKSILLESDASVSDASLPGKGEGFEHDCDFCGKTFMVVGEGYDE
jgi:hypothetical protein